AGGSRQASRELLATSIPTNEAKEPSMEKPLSCECELGSDAVRRRLWQLFGLIPKSRRRSRSRTVSEDPGLVDLSSAAVGQAAPLRDVWESLRFAACPTARSI